MARRLVILGTSGLAREMALVAERLNEREQRWDSVGFIGEPGCTVGQSLGFGPILGDDAWLLSQTFEADVVIGIGFPKIKAKVIAAYVAQPGRFSFPNLIHPTAEVNLRRVKMGRGNVVTAHCSLTCDIDIGDFNLFNLNTTVGHDARIGCFNVFNPSVNVSGGVSVDDRVLVGTGAQILENRHIGHDAIVGAGSVVRTDVAAGTTVVGVPARELEKKT